MTEKLSNLLMKRSINLSLWIGHSGKYGSRKIFTVINL